MKLVDYPEDFVVFDSRTLPKSVIYGDDELIIDRKKEDRNNITKIIKVLLARRYGRLAEIVSSLTDNVDEQLAALTLWYIYKYKPSREELLKILPRSGKLRRYFLPYLLIADEKEREEVRRQHEKAKEERRRRLAEKILSEQGFEILQQLVDLYNKGVPVKAMPRLLGLPGLEHVYALLDYAEKLKLIVYRKKTGHTTYKRLSEAERQRIIELCKEGISVYKIAKIMKRGVGTVHKICKEVRKNNIFR